jgi:hypothetical protein
MSQPKKLSKAGRPPLPKGHAKAKFLRIRVTPEELWAGCPMFPRLKRGGSGSPSKHSQESIARAPSNGTGARRKRPSDGALIYSHEIIGYAFGIAPSAIMASR